MISKMKAKKHIEQEVDKTLDSLDGIQKAVANPYLYTRIKAKLEKVEKSVWGIVISFVGRPAVALAAVLLVVLINASIIFKSGSGEAQSTGQDPEQLFASEYNLSDTIIYDSTIDPE
jgi:nucleoside phosphorylase